MNYILNIVQYSINTENSMKYTFKLLDTTTGKEHLYEDSYNWPDEQLMLFQWTENNYSCDCNRSIFLGLPERPCGDTIQLISITRPDNSNIPLPKN